MQNAKCKMQNEPKSHVHPSSFILSPINAMTGTETALDLYRRMLLIRVFETRAGELCRKGGMPAFIHLYVGEEATAVGVCSLLRDGDVLTSPHRGHGHVLARGADPDRLMAVLYHRPTAP